MDKSLFRIALLGAVTGLMAAVLVTLFRQYIEISQTLFLPDGRVGNNEALPDWWVEKCISTKAKIPCSQLPLTPLQSPPHSTHR